MKVLLYDRTNAFLTPGGKTTHALKLKKEISRLGIDIDFGRWWDRNQQGADLIHFLSVDPIMLETVKSLGIKSFFSMIFDFETNRSPFHQRKAILKTRLFDMMPKGVRNMAWWHALQYVDRVQFMHVQDRDCALRFYPNQLSMERTVVIPHAYDPDDMFISDGLDIGEKNLPDRYLVSCANISPRKQTLKLARFAKMAKVPVVFMGGHIPCDPYFQAFESEVDNRYVFYPGYVEKEWRDCIERNASGYVLLSLGESGCIAVYEAAAYQMPLLLSNLPWAWGYDRPTDVHFCDQDDGAKAVEQLADFYVKSGHLDHKPFNAMTWAEVARLYVAEYERLLA